MKRPLIFAVECVVAMAIAVAGAWLASKAGRKMNAKANGDIRAAAAQERIAEALERAYPAPKPLPRPSMIDDVGPITRAETTGCIHVLKVGHEDDPRYTVCGI